MRTLSKKTDFIYLANTQVIYHCHHFNLFLDQTIDDALGVEVATKLKIKVAHSASYQLLSNLVKESDAQTVMERLELASTYFAAMGHGKLSISGDKNGGTAKGDYLHYGFSWSNKYGKIINRLHPADAFATGFSAAALEIAYDLEPYSLASEEHNCVTLKSKQCDINIFENKDNNQYKIVTREEAQASCSDPIQSLFEEDIEPIVKGLLDFTAEVSGDKERGIVEAFGVFVTLHLTDYYNGISYETLNKCGDNPTIVSALGELLRESGHVCVFNTIGGLVLSAEWEGLIGKPSGNPQELITYFIAGCRAFGFGKWCIKEFVADERFVLETSSSYENSYCNKFYKNLTHPTEYLIQGAALAFMVLINKLDWENHIDLTPELYNSLFKGGLGWKVEQTKGLSTGDPITQVVVTKTK